jgi:Fic family protein
MRKRFYDDLAPDLRANLLVQIRNLWTHTSTALEGNTLSLGETDFILSEGLTIAGKPLKDHREVVGHARAIDIIYKLLERETLETQDLFALHASVLTEAVVDIFSPAGAWKREPNSTNAIGPNGAQVIIEFPAPDRVPDLMQQWLARFNALRPDTAENAIAAYAGAHLEFVSIHPFFDGNGRVARLASNLPVLRSGAPPIVVPKERRLEYLRAIAAYQLSIPRFPEFDEFPINDERAAFTTLCASFVSETRALEAAARRLQAERDYRKP